MTQSGGSSLSRGTPLCVINSQVDRETELALVGRLRTGDPAAFDVVYEAYHRGLYTFLLRLSRRRDSAEDLVEETWLRLVTHAGRLSPDTRLGPWLFAVARNLHYSAGRARRMLDLLLPGDLMGVWPMRSHADSPFDTAVGNQLQRRIERALGQLAPGDREVLLLVGVEGFTPAEAAAICATSAETFRQRLSRARARLARRLEAAPSTRRPAAPLRQEPGQS